MSQVNNLKDSCPQFEEQKLFNEQKWTRGVHSVKAEKRKKVRKTQAHKNNKSVPKLKYGPQSGESSLLSERLNNFMSLIPKDNDIVYSTLLSEVETLIALVVSLRECKSVKQASSILFLYFKTKCSYSVFQLVIQYFSDEFNWNILTSQALDDEPQPDWLKLLSSASYNWKSITDNTAFKKVSKLISMCAALGLCDIGKFNFDISGVRVFSLSAYDKHVSAFDIMDAIMDTCIYFVEGGYQCFKLKSLSPFIYSDSAAVQFEKDYLDIVEMATSVKTGNLEKRYGISENDYDYRLNRTIDLADSLYKASKGTWEKKILYDRVTRLRSLRTDFLDFRVSGKLREAPFAVFIHGESGVGKSSVSNIVMKSVLLANDFEASDDRIITLNENDKYMSTYKSHINGIFIDDLGNTVAQFVEKSPCSKIIEIVNNIPAYANMAELDLKGKISVEPKCVVLNSNLLLQSIAKLYSNKYFSIVRRAPVHLEVRVKEEYRVRGETLLDPAKVLEKFGEDCPLPDVWEIDVSIPCDDSQVSTTVIMKSASIFQALDFLLDKSKTHFANQKMVVANNTDLDIKLQFCKLCSRPGTMCNCQQAGFTDSCSQAKEYISELIQLDSVWFNYLNYIPDSFFQTRFFQYIVAFHYRKQFIETFCTSFYYMKLVLCIFSITFWFYPIVSFLCFAGASFILSLGILYKRHSLFVKLRDTRNTMPVVFKRVRDEHFHYIAGSCFVLGCLYRVIQSWKLYRRMTEQGNLNPVSEQEISERDAEQNPWMTAVINELPVSRESRSVVPNELARLVFKNLCAIEIQYDGKARHCNAFFVCSNVAVIPQHMWAADEVKAKFLKYDESKTGSVFHAYLSKRTSYHIPNTDLCVVWVPNGGSWRDLSKFLPLGSVPSCPVTFVYKTKEGKLRGGQTRADPEFVVTGVSKFQGYTYNLPFETFNGLCMGTLVSENKAPAIIGFHLGGIAGSTYGAAGILTKQDFDTAVANIRDVPGVMISSSAGTLPTQIYDVQFYHGPKIHEKSPIKFLTQGSHVEYYGQVDGRASYYSDVEPTIISETIEEVCGVPQKWAGPKFHAWKPWQASLEHSSKPSAGMEGHLIVKAVMDYIEPLQELVRTREYLRNDIRKLTPMEVVCGIDGKRFIDKMPANTSVGFPMSGPKSNFLTNLDPAEHKDFSYPVELDSKFWNEAERMERTYISGERCYPIFKACLKDEPTKISSEKVRVFQSAPIALQLLIRKYFLSTARFLSIFPLVSECAVGVNAHGPEWDTLVNHMKKYGEDRILAGDYSKYDLRMPAQLMFAAFDILCRLARESGNFTEDDMRVMSGLATDVCYSVTAFNGDLIQLFGSNPSGQNLTVYINSIVNCLLFRCGYFALCPHQHAPSFRTVCSLMTYGDDAKSSVRVGHDYFNHISLAQFLSHHDMKFTMPDKESVPTKYMLDSEADFLKRRNIWNERLNLWTGALDEMSIFKSLHAVLKSSAVSNAEQSMMNIDGALREWFYHGRDVYEFRRIQMNEVAKKCNIAHGCKGLHLTYEDLEGVFMVKYLKLKPPVEIKKEELKKLIPQVSQPTRKSPRLIRHPYSNKW